MAGVFFMLPGGRIRARLTWASVEVLRLSEGMQVYTLIKTVSFDHSLI